MTTRLRGARTRGLIYACAALAVATGAGCSADSAPDGHDDASESTGTTAQGLATGALGTSTTGTTGTTGKTLGTKLPPILIRTPRALAGVTLGEPLNAVEARCAGLGWTCTRRARAVAGNAIERLHVQLPSSSADFNRLIVIAKDGTVIGIRAAYRDHDDARYDKLAAAYGAGTKETKDGLGATWTWADTQAELSRTGSTLLLVATDTAKALQLALPAKLLPSRLATLNRANLAQLPVMQMDPGVVSLPDNQRIGVTITLDSLKCNDEDDASSIFYGDSPYIYMTGLHTAGTQPWPSTGAKEKSWGDVESGDTVTINQPIFADGDARRNVARGEYVAFHAALFESDSTSFDDEIDFVQKAIPFTTLVAQAGRTISGSLVFEGDGAKYTLYYHYTVGQPVTIADNYGVFGHASAQPWEGSYTWNVDGRTGVAAIHFTAPSLTYPDGQLSGTWTENGRTLTLATKRLFGNFFDFYLIEPGQSVTPFTRHNVGYLVGSGASSAIAGTSYSDIKTGFFMRRTP